MRRGPASARPPQECSDRLTGMPIPIDRLKTYVAALAQYHLHPESKFLNGDYLDTGPTERRHICVAGIHHIGKEANRWEEQFYLGYDPETQIEYGTDESGTASIRERVCRAARKYGQRRLADMAGVSRERLRLFVTGKATPRAQTIRRLLRAISVLSPNTAPAAGSRPSE